MFVKLWCARLERPLTSAEETALLAELPAERRERILRFSGWSQRREPLCAYHILRRALAEQYHWQSLPPMALGPMGKPWFPDFPDVQFNLSHTAGAVLAGLSDAPLGVDIEGVRPVSPRLLSTLPNGGAAGDFFQSWVRREALAKRAGRGVGIPRAGETAGEDSFYYKVETFPGFLAGAATGGPSPELAGRYSQGELLADLDI